MTLKKPHRLFCLRSVLLPSKIQTTQPPLVKKAPAIKISKAAIESSFCTPQSINPNEIFTSSGIIRSISSSSLFIIGFPGLFELLACKALRLIYGVPAYTGWIELSSLSQPHITTRSSSSRKLERWLAPLFFFKPLNAGEERGVNCDEKRLRRRKREGERGFLCELVYLMMLGGELLN